MLVSLQSALVRNAELIAFEASGNIRMGFRVHVGVDANTHRCDFAQRQRHFIKYIQFGFALYIEAGDTGLQADLHFCTCLANTGKNHILRLSTGGLYAG